MKKNGKINIIDLGVVLIVLLFVAGLGIRLFSSASDAAKEVKRYEVTVEVENIRDFSVAAIKKGGKLTDEKNTKVIGEIIEVTDVPYEVEEINSSGEAVITSKPGRNKCIVTIHVDGKELNNRYFIDEKTELAPGRNLELNSKYVSTSGMITSVNELN